jgi:hypothetical protein
VSIVNIAGNSVRVTQVNGQVIELGDSFPLDFLCAWLLLDLRE